MFTRTAAPATTLPRRRSLQAAAVGTVGLLALAACGTDDADDADSTGETGTAGDVVATATVADADGNDLGTAELSTGGEDTGNGDTGLSVEVSGLQPGMYGMHLHAVGECEPDSVAPDDDADDPETGDFLSAGGHLGADGHNHPDHGGDLPALLVNSSGEGRMTVVTDRIDESEIFDDDGSAIIIHENADNYANIPERYAPDGPDEDTLSTGDAGGRQACGVFEAP